MTDGEAEGSPYAEATEELQELIVNARHPNPAPENRASMMRSHAF